MNSTSDLLSHFMTNMRELPINELTFEHFKQLVMPLQLTNAVIEQHLQFNDDTYTRHFVCRTPQFDLLLLGWKTGQFSSIHDHSNSWSAVRVIRGILTSRTFKIVDNQLKRMPARLVSEEEGHKEQWAFLDRGEVHQLGNVAPENLVTMHVYSPPLRTMTYYFTDSTQTEQIQVHP